MRLLVQRLALALAVATLTFFVSAIGFEVLAHTVLFSPAFVPEKSQSEAMRAFGAARMLESWHDHGLSYRGRPHARIDLYGIEYRHDSRGLRSPDFASEKGATEFRILVLGDSNTYGWRAKENDTFSALLQRALVADFAARGVARRVTVINAGLPGYNSRDEYLRYRSLEADAKPDLVLLAWYANDCERFGFQVDVEGFLDFDPLPTPVEWKPLLLRSYAYRWLKERRTDDLRKAGQIDIHEPTAFEFSTRFVQQLAQDVAARGSRFLLLDVPVLEPDDKSQRISIGGYREKSLSAKLEAFAKANSLPFLSLLPAIDGQPAALLWGSIEQNDHHPNAKAHALFANALFPFLRAANLVP